MALIKMKKEMLITGKRLNTLTSYPLLPRYINVPVIAFEIAAPELDTRRSFFRPTRSISWVAAMFPQICTTPITIDDIFGSIVDPVSLKMVAA